MTTSQDRYGDDFGAEQMWGLQELPLPDPIAYTPQTLGWLIVALALIALLAWLAWRWRRAWLRDAWRREAIAQLDAIEADPGRLHELPRILRRSALQVAPRVSVASLRGDAWIAWLNDCAGQPVFAPDDALRLDELAYGGGTQAAGAMQDHRRLIDSGRRWLRGAA